MNNIIELQNKHIQVINETHRTTNKQTPQYCVFFCNNRHFLPPGMFRDSISLPLWPVVPTVPFSWYINMSVVNKQKKRNLTYFISNLPNYGIRLSLRSFFFFFYFLDATLKDGTRFQNIPTRRTNKNIFFIRQFLLSMFGTWVLVLT